MARSITIGGTNQTAYLVAGSLSVKLNTADFGLSSPAVIPDPGDAVVMVDPAWEGTVSCVEDGDLLEGVAQLTVSISATNDDVGEASAAPFGLSDDPDNVNTFPYADLRITHTRNLDTTETTTGSLTCYEPGLWPAMTFELTSANRGLAAESYTVTDAEIIDLSDDATATLVTFGDPIVTMSVWVASKAADAPDGSISGTKITDDTITTPKLTADCITANELDAGCVGFDQLAPSARDVISGYLPNNTFTDATAGALTMAAARGDEAGASAELPYWQPWRDSGSGTATVAADTDWPGGHYVSMAYCGTGSSSATNVALTSDPAVIQPGQEYQLQYTRSFNVPAGVTLWAKYALRWHAADGSYLSEVSQQAGTTTSDGLDQVTIMQAQAPADARYVRGEIITWEADAHDAGTWLRIGQMTLINLGDGSPYFTGTVYAEGKVYSEGHTVWTAVDAAADMASLTADVTLTTAGTWYAGPSLSLTAGTWLLVGHATGYAGAASKYLYTRLYDSTHSETHAEGQQRMEAAVFQSITLAAVVDLGEAATLRLDGTSEANGGKLYKALSAHGAADAATTLCATRVS